MTQDSTAALIAYFGKPWVNHNLLVDVPVPFKMTFLEDDGKTLIPITHVLFHKKAAGHLLVVFNKVAEQAQTDPSVLKHLTHFSGSYNYRPIRGSTRLSYHAFGLAIDFDAENQGMTHNRCFEKDQPQFVYDTFISEGFLWGGNFSGRKDPMHYEFHIPG